MVGTVQNVGLIQSFISNADQTDGQGTFQSLHTDAGEVVLTGAGLSSIGVLQNNPDADEQADVVTGWGSIVQVLSNAAGITPGAEVAADAAGKAIAAVSTDYVLGYALNTTTNVDEYVQMVFAPTGLKA